VCVWGGVACVVVGVGGCGWGWVWVGVGGWVGGGHVCVCAAWEREECSKDNVVGSEGVQGDPEGGPRHSRGRCRSIGVAKVLGHVCGMWEVRHDVHLACACLLVRCTVGEGVEGLLLLCRCVVVLLCCMKGVEDWWVWGAG
jgi:hypothetical protein